MQGATDRRLFIRTALKLPVKVAPDFTGETVDLSETGLNFTTDKSLKSAKSRLTMEFPGKESVTTEFQVVWNRHLAGENKYNYGACFTRLGSNESELLRAAVIKNETQDIIRRVSDENIQTTLANFFTKDVKEFIGYLKDAQRNIISWDSGIQDKTDSYSHNLVAKGNSILDKIDDRRIIKDTKKKFRSIVGLLPYKSQLMKQGLNKPYGYPGDFDVIEKIYNNVPLSEGIGGCFDTIFLENPYARAVRSRKEKMKELLTAFIEESDLPAINILNLGCGPCREIRELFIDENFNTKKEIHFNLLDQDKEALGFAQNLLGNKRQNINFNFLQADVLSFPQSPAFRKLAKQHLIYSIGLADYLPDRILKKIIRDYFGLVACGGQLIIAHKDKDKDPQAPVFPDWFCDWHFVTRNEEYLTRLINGLNLKNISIERSIEKTGKIIFLHLKKDS